MSTSPAVPSASVPTTLTLHEDKQCKGSVRYATNDPEAPIQSIYVQRSWLPQMPKSIVVTLTIK